ncbi:hypothetical protein [Siccirubricoccus sp. G192]|uniref:hypothetical protein n=1 Tax=Siccirubricoccus sp. G192 TaxID=2849651 RepID=UPI001C2C1038|nr:hypothetical protein [Siccirubricoccus sp. G192]MBV1795724.1 hypothetical protein [Siccirubricoccus sp. G192]
MAETVLPIGALELWQPTLMMILLRLIGYQVVKPLPVTDPWQSTPFSSDAAMGRPSDDRRKGGCPSE